MIDIAVAQEPLSKLIAWKNHFDSSEIPEFEDSKMTETETGMYYQDIHAALSLQNIAVCLPDNRDLEEYLKETELGAISQVLNDLQQHKQLKKAGKELVNNNIISNGRGLSRDNIMNESRLVGLRLTPISAIGLCIQINKIALQVTQQQGEDFKLYLYHSHEEEPVDIIDYQNTGGGRFQWNEARVKLHADSQERSGGHYYLCYYQDDLIGQATQYKKLNFEKGTCIQCDGGVSNRLFKSLIKYCGMYGFYLPNGDINEERKMFDEEKIFLTANNNWGFNLNVSTSCDLTSFVIDNRETFKTVMGYQVAYKILRMMQFSTEINSLTEDLQMMIIRDLEGDKETKKRSLPTMYEKAMESLNFNLSGVNPLCIPCHTNTGNSVKFF